MTWIWFELALGFLLCSTALFYVQLAQINSRLLQRERISWLFGYPGKALNISRRHKQLFPKSRLGLYSDALGILAITLCMLGLFKAGFFQAFFLQGNRPGN